MQFWKNIYFARWTKGSKECYFRGCRCADCPTFQILGDKCKMKESVINLVRRYGAPPKEERGLNEN